MNLDNEQHDQGDPTAQAPQGDRSPDALAGDDSRRRFVADVGKKLFYVAPVVLTLSARQAQAGSGSAPS